MGSGGGLGPLQDRTHVNAKCVEENAAENAAEGVEGMVEAPVRDCSIAPLRIVNGGRDPAMLVTRYSTAFNDSDGALTVRPLMHNPVTVDCPMEALQCWCSAGSAKAWWLKLLEDVLCPCPPKI